MVKKYFFSIQIITFFCLLFFFPLKSLAQCAGDDAASDVCDIANISSQTVNLFGLLGGAPTKGGIWTDDDSSGGLNVISAELNVQEITKSGIYHYTYTVLGAGGCVDNSATVTITVGGYSGVTGPNALVCSDQGNFNLFQVFNGSYLSPQSNGTWYNDTNKAPIPGNSVDTKALGPGTFQFTYSLPAIGSCPAVSSTAFVTIARAPEPGTPSNLLLCDTNVGGYTNLDLNALLVGEDPGGKWTENNGTSEITSATDHFINVQQIYNTFGEGNYTFTYTVLPTSIICDKKTADVRIRIEKRLDFTGATLVVNSDICQPEIPTATYSVTLTKGPQAIPNGQYYVSYTVSGANGGSNIVTAAFNNGVLNFPISSAYFQQVGSFNVAITSIIATTSEGACTNIINNLSDVLNVFPTPVLEPAKLTISPICQNKNALVQITGATALANGTYDIIYKLTGANTSTVLTATITFTGGSSSFTVPSAMTLNAGNTIVTITNITNSVTKCTNTSNVSGTLLINPLPDPVNYKVHVDDFCLNQPVSVALSGLGSLANITITYNLSGSNVATAQTVSLVVTGGITSFIIPLNLLTNTGITNIAITNLVNDDTTCDVVITNLSDTFQINPIPVAPTSTNQIFCTVDGATIANLIPNGTQYKWYNSATITTVLPVTYVLKSENYYVTETSAAGCTSLPTMITVTVNDVPAPVLNQDGQNFCGINNPKISDLSNNTNVPASVVWYDALNNGNLLPASALLTDKSTYYGFDFSATTNCISENSIGVTVSLTDCDDSEYKAFFIPDGFSPNGDNVNDTFTIPEIDFLYPDYTLEIYNRYGNVMFKGNKDKPNWDGKNSESAGFGDGIAPNGVYFYVIRFNKDNRPPQQGRLYLNR